MEKKIILEGNNFIATKFIGAGSFGKVYLGETKETNQICAIKKIKLKNKANKEWIKNKMSRSLEIMKRVEHENCVELFFIEPEDYQNADLIYIVMEYCDILGLEYLYESEIVHRDLKPENILLQKNIDSKFGYTFKLTDFDFARTIPRFENAILQMETQVGTRLYMAPEMLSSDPYTSNVDLWSLGAILYEIITGNPAFQGFGIQDIREQIKDLSEKKSLPKDYIKIVGKECNDLVEKLLTVDPHSRITRKKLYKHPFISEKLKIKIIGIAKEDFESKENGKFSFKKGDIIEIIKIKKYKGICEGKLKEKEGIIELKRIDLYEEIEDISSINELNESNKSNKSNNNNNNQLINFEKRIIGIVSNEYKTNEISLSKEDLVEIININEENESCIIQFRNQKYEIPFFFFDFYKKIGNQNENSKKKIFGIAKIDSQNDEDDDNFLSFSKGDEVEIIENDGEIGIGKLNGKEGEIFIDDFDIKEN
ncbi:ovarian-specific serine/threonine-protein kinase lok-related [Anaeramoeba ignava]|uniref:Ovarian-specific serine/threonine-protein kinase lok-related n=1 Tax=Anaeramoeba ignava TaxID=1746090 RepID=A0A9Q0LWE1_ANAIG|nr:ovarian-specific serine/threonine-protein kinase lok-related [Anaeramoeba ignava]